MSTQHYLICRTCKKYYLAGQSHERKGSDHIYDGEKVGQFLYEHMNHHLEYTSDWGDELCEDSGWEEVV